ncbi:MAG TPA: maltotransferase domain-containing protein, partial [Bryobacteraceae bacterium]|nr:maltotransferase domain-containing protein [Bryobacteraceae bacterium]
MSTQLNQPQKDGRSRIIIESVEPQVDSGRFAAKRVAGDIVTVEADVFTDGHDAVSAVLRFRRLSESEWSEIEMQHISNDRWRAEFTVAEIGVYEFTVAGWVDGFKTWHRDLLKRIAASQDAPVDYLIGADLIDRAAALAVPGDKEWLARSAASLRSSDTAALKRAVATDVRLVSQMQVYPDRSLQLEYDRTLRITVDPLKARFSSWYEFFPRSAAAEPGRHGTFRDCEQWLPYVAGMGFDVLYFPPIHPIGENFRKGKNNAVTAEPEDEGSPWAIGSGLGGHKAVHPKLGTLEDFRRLVQKARELGIDIALDIAFQASPDHPYVAEHKEWFRQRPDGTIQYAENPPKKYQDIYPFDFESSDWLPMWDELRSVFFYWLEQGVRIFRVDNPHTKAFPFWEWTITTVKERYPE